MASRRLPQPLLQGGARYLASLRDSTSITLLHRVIASYNKPSVNSTTKLSTPMPRPVKRMASVLAWKSSIRWRAFRFSCSVLVRPTSIN